MSLPQVAVTLAARIFIGLLFLASGIHKLGHYTETAAYMSSAGVPGLLLPPTIALEVGGAVLILLGWHARAAALALAGFAVLTALLFHADTASDLQTVMFMKNIAVAGGLLMIVAQGPGVCSLDEAARRRQQATAAHGEAAP
jgi:putative oxidoreductase